MRRLIPFVILFIAFQVVVTRPAVASPIVFGNNKWTLMEWWSGNRGMVPPGLTNPMEAFGMDATRDRQIRNTDQMPGIGKVSGILTRTASFQTVKLGAVFTRDFSLTTESDLTAKATLNGIFSASGMFFSNDNGTDMINADASVGVQDRNGQNLFGSGVAFASRTADPDAPPEFRLIQGRFRVTDSKMNHMVLKEGDYRVVFNFSSDLQLTGLPNRMDQLQTSFFQTFTADLSAVPIPEPSTFALLSMGLIGLAVAAVRRRRVAHVVTRRVTRRLVRP